MELSAFDLSGKVALFTRMSTGPTSAAILSTIAWTASQSVTSAT